MLCVLSFTFVGCDKRTKEEKNFTYPSSSDRVYSNGGLAVRKGNYVYFVNGFQSIENQSDKEQTYSVGSLMLMKLDSNGNVVTDDDGLLRDDYYITMSNKLCGYEATNLFICGEYLYFVCPSAENESGDKVWAKERVTFNRIKLDKTSKVEEVYASNVKFDQLEYEYYICDGKPYILAWEKGEAYYDGDGNNALVRVDINENEDSIISNDVQDVVFAENHDEIFFTKKDGKNYEIKKYNISSDSLTDYTTFSKSVDLIGVAGGRVFLTTAHDYGSSTDVLVSTISNQSAFVELYSYANTQTVSVSEDGYCAVLVESNRMTLVSETGFVKVVVDEEATNVKVIGFVNGSVVYLATTSSNSVLKTVSYSNVLAGSEAVIETLATWDTISEDMQYFDISSDEDYMYFLKQTGSNYYLHRIKLTNNFDEVEEMFGVYESGDIPEKVEEDSENEEEQE